MIAKAVAVAAALAAAALGLAGPASAQLTAGYYTGTPIEGNAFGPDETITIKLTECGPNCLAILPNELHLQGNTWTGYDGDLAITIDNDSLRMTVEPPPAGDMRIWQEFQLSKDG